MRTDEIVVIGGGPAGVSAAFTARNRGASVTLIDEQSAIGGYLRWTLSVQRGLPPQLDGRRGFEVAEMGWNVLYDSGVNVQLHSTAWGLFEDNVLGVVNPESSYQLKADKVIVASGSTDACVPFPGWELAGVMTARAALIAINVHRVLPGRRVALVGNGPEAAEVREAIETAGAEVVAHFSDIARFGAGGEGVVEWVTQGGERINIDALVTVFGSQPDPALPLQALAQTGYSELSGMHVPLRSATLETTSPGVYVVGDAGGLCSTAEASAEGRVAAEAAVEGDDLEQALEQLSETRSVERAAELSRLRPAAAAS
ncbi:hypothetical protein BH24CHL1_BH24CHL1_18400 [soil metagenome]